MSAMLSLLLGIASTCQSELPISSRTLSGLGIDVGIERLAPAEEILVRQAGIRWVKRRVGTTDIAQTSRLDEDMRQFRRMNLNIVLDVSEVAEPDATAARLGTRYRGANVIFAGNSLGLMPPVSLSDIGFEFVPRGIGFLATPYQTSGLRPLGKAIARVRRSASIAEKVMMLTPPETISSAQYFLSAIAHDVPVVFATTIQRLRDPSDRLREITELTRQLEGCQLRQRLILSDSNAVGMVFARGTQPVVAAWSERDERPVQIGDWAPRLRGSIQYWTPEVRQRELDLAIQLPYVSPFTVIRVREDLERLICSVAKSAPKNVEVQVTMDVPVIGKRRLSTSVDDPELESKLDRLGVYIPQSASTMLIEFKVSIVTLRTELIHASPITVERIPSGPGTCAVRVNSHDPNLKPTVRLTTASVVPDVNLDAPGTATFPWRREDPAYVIVEANRRPIHMGELPREVRLEPANWSTSTGVKLVKERATGLPDLVGTACYGLRITKSAVLNVDDGFGNRWPQKAVWFGLWVKASQVGTSAEISFGNGGEVHLSRPVGTDWQYVSFPVSKDIFDQVGTDRLGEPGDMRVRRLTFRSKSSEEYAVQFSDPYVWYEREY
jgi:hypothetical protein